MDTSKLEKLMKVFEEPDTHGMVLLRVDDSFTSAITYDGKDVKDIAEEYKELIKSKEETGKPTEVITGNFAEFEDPDLSSDIWEEVRKAFCDMHIFNDMHNYYGGIFDALKLFDFECYKKYLNNFTNSYYPNGNKIVVSIVYNDSHNFSTSCIDDLDIKFEVYEYEH
jgi:hypothetical protein